MVDTSNNVWSHFYGKNMLVPADMTTKVSKNYFQRSSRYVRDVQIWDMPILPGAVFNFQQLCSTREWQITGKIRPATRAVEFLNDAKVVTNSGYIYTGFEEFIRRRSLDYLTVGRTAFSYQASLSKPVLEYLDPTYLFFERHAVPSGNQIAVSPNEQVWRYNIFNNRRMRAKDVTLSHPIPVGAEDYFIAPVSFVLPAAVLAWLLREHDSAALDGRKLREILIVGSDQMQSAIENAVKQLVALHAGADPSKTGIPIVTVNNLSGQPIANQIAQIGLSSIPENFDRKQFTFDYANQIASATGLALREFWNEESTTNRALEQVQEQRGQRKGPSAFIRTEERLINNSGMLKQFGGKLYFSFIEEYDNSSQKTNAEVLKLTADALAAFSGVFGVSWDLKAVESWMQAIRVLPADIELISDEANAITPQQEAQETTIQRPDSPPIPDKGKNERILSGDNTENTPQVRHFVPDYDEVILNQEGRVIEKRLKTFSIPRYLIDLHKSTTPETTPPDSSNEFEESVLETQSENLKQYRTLWETNPDAIRDVLSKQILFSGIEVDKAHNIAIDSTEESPLPEPEQIIIDYVLGELS